MTDPYVTEDERVPFESPLVMDGGIVHVEITVGGDRFAAFDFREPQLVTACRVALMGYHYDSDELTTGKAVTVAQGGNPARVEDIAKWIAGDGTDAQRLALADGIRRGDWRP